eukprot:TRINITY_DN17145_c0_g1_i1.p1 TRINITY_DN17145_c0_g1~~TRINITY_DN17145_c0_g1_i1.p1  ORF type:complete len:574 (+),score=194.15 TRINITY_DN17145_c0_g1_i1:49-1770(+)
MSDGEWQVVDSKGKKKVKDQLRQEKKNTLQKSLEKHNQEELEKKESAKRAYEAQYASVTGTASSYNSYGALLNPDLDKPTKSQLRAEARRRKQNSANDPFDGEELRFVAPPQESKKLKSGKTTRTKKRQTNKKTTPGMKDLNDALAEFDEDSLLDKLDYVKKTYPDNYQVQLKSIAEYFESAFDNVEDEGMEEDGPLSYFDSNIVGHFTDWLNGLPNGEITQFLTFLIDFLVRSHGPSKQPRPHVGGLGTKLLAQIVMEQYPDEVLDAIPYIQSKCIDKSTNTFPSQHAHFFLWLFSQALPEEPSVALTLWLKFMLPAVLNQGTARDLRSEYMSFLNDILNTTDTFQVENHLASDAFEKILVAKYSFDRYPAELDRLLDLNVLFTGQDLRDIFRRILNHADDEREKLKDHALSILSACLKSSESLFEVWKDFYSDAIGASNNLMIHLHRTFKSKGGISGNLISKIAKTFLETNERMKKGYVDPKTKKSKKLTPEIRDLIEVSNQTYTSIRSKMSSHEVPDRSNNGGQDGGSSGLLVMAAMGVVASVGALLGLSMYCCDMGACKASPLGHFLEC